MTDPHVLTVDLKGPGGESLEAYFARGLAEFHLQQVYWLAEKYGMMDLREGDFNSNAWQRVLQAMSLMAGQLGAPGVLTGHSTSEELSDALYEAAGDLATRYHNQKEEMAAGRREVSLLKSELRRAYRALDRSKSHLVECEDEQDEQDEGLYTEVTGAMEGIDKLVPEGGS